MSGVTDFLNIHSPTRLSFHPGSVHMGEDRSGCETYPGILVSSNTSSSLLLLRPGAAGPWFTSAFLICFSPNYLTLLLLIVYFISLLLEIPSAGVISIFLTRS